MAEQHAGFRSLTAPGMGAEEATEVALAVLAANDDTDARSIAPGRIGFSRVRRPPWATVLCVATVWIGGLGLLFLLIRHTEAGEIIITDGPQGCLAVVPPVLGGAATLDLDRALRSAAAPRADVVPIPARTDRGHDDAMHTPTVARGDLPPPPLPAPARSDAASNDTDTAPPALLWFAAGQIRVEPGTSVVLGRDPTPGTATRAQAVPGDASSVSKSHLLVAFDGVTVTVQDLDSTNGSTRSGDGGDETLQPGTPVVLTTGDRLVLGALGCTVEITAPPLRP